MLSVVVPVFNEQARLEATLEETLAYLAAHHPGDHELVISDDGSTDASVAIVERFMRHAPEIRLLRAPANEGKGAAVCRGMLAAKGDPVFFFDADLSTPLSEVGRFLERFAAEPDLDVVIGTRKHPDAQIERYQPWYRVWLGLGYTRLVHRVTRTHFSDYTCGFKAFRRAAVADVFGRSRLRGWSFDAEVLYLAHRLGQRVAEIPVHWADEPDSRVRLLRALWRSFWELMEIRKNERAGLYDRPHRVQ